jgi:soluble lytic murein transglycosylase-like protein
MSVKRSLLLCLLGGALSLSAHAVTPKPELLEWADQAAKRYGLDQDLFRALIEHESTWKANAVSPMGAIGLTQMMPATARAECGLSVEELHDPQKNLDCGARYLSKQIERFGSVKQALCAFNAGPNLTARLGRCPNIKVTRRYVEKILSSREDAYLKMNGL